MTRHPVTPTAGAPGRRGARPAHGASPPGRLRQRGGREHRRGAAVGQSLGDLLLAAESSTLSPRQQQAAAVAASRPPSTSQLARLVGALRHHPPHRRHRQRAHHGRAQHAVSRDGRGPAHERQAPVPGRRAPRCPVRCAGPRRCRARPVGRASRRCARSRTPPTPCTSTCGRAPRGTSGSTSACTSPEGDLVLAAGQLTVRSISTSAVAIALSVGAAVVLLVWWGRTVWRRQGARGAHTRTPRQGGRRRDRARRAAADRGAVPQTSRRPRTLVDDGCPSDGASPATSRPRRSRRGAEVPSRRVRR